MPLPKAIDLLRAGASGSNVFSSQAVNQTSVPVLSAEPASVASSVESYMRNISQPGQTLAFPRDVGHFHLNLDIFERQTGTSAGLGYGPGGQPRLMRIKLPMAAMNDAHSIKWQEQTWDFLLNTAKDAFGEGIRNATSAGFGVIVNTAMAVLFQGPMYKGYDLHVILAPRNVEESILIRRIIAWIRWGVSSEYAVDGFAFQFPSVFRLEYSENITDYGQNVRGFDFGPIQTQRWQTASRWQAFKPAVLKSLSVNYAPTGHPIIMESGYPEAVKLSMKFMEIEYWLKSDFVREREGLFTPGPTDGPTAAPAPGAQGDDPTQSAEDGVFGGGRR